MLTLSLCGEFLLQILCILHFYAEGFSYTSRASFIFMQGNSLTHPMLPSSSSFLILFYFILLSGEFLFQTQCWFLFIPREFLLHIPCWLHFSLSGEFLLHIPCWLKFHQDTFADTSHADFIFIRGGSITHSVLVLFLCRGFLLHIPCCLRFCAGSFAYTSQAAFIFVGGVSLTHPMSASFYAGVSLTHPELTSCLCGEILLHIPCYHF